MTSLVVHTTTAEETEELGGRLARSLPEPSNFFGVVYLVGDLGAGKTTLTRGFLRALGVTGTVKSPTYTLVESYETQVLTVLHLDLYRLTDPEEFEDLGLRDAATSGHAWLVEWPDRGGDRLPPPDLVITLIAGDHGHDLAIDARSALGRAWGAAL